MFKYKFEFKIKLLRIVVNVIYVNKKQLHIIKYMFENYI